MYILGPCNTAAHVGSASYHCTHRPDPMHWKMTAYLLVAIPLITGCASTLNSGKQQIVINSEPAGAEVYLRGSEVGVTPYTYTYDLLDGTDVGMEVRKEGHELVTFSLKPAQSNTVLFVDALLLNIPYIADSKSNALYGFPVNERSLRLSRTLTDTDRPIELPVLQIENKLGHAPKLGHIGPRTVTDASREATDLRYPESLTGQLVSGMKKAPFQPLSTRKGTQRGDETIKRAKLYVRPVLRGVTMDLKEVDDLCYGHCETRVDWLFHSATANDSSLFQYEVTTRTPIYGERKREVLGHAMTDAGRHLLDQEGLQERLRSSHAAGLVLSKGDLVVLHPARAATYTSKRDMMPELVKAVVTIGTKDGHGSGFLITNDGYLLTNAHVVEDNATVQVRFQQGFSLEGQVLKVNTDFDLALIKVPGTDLPALTIGDDKVVQVGEEVYAIGTPLDEKLGQSVTRGIVSGKRDLEDRAYIQTDVSINHGNSGGPLIDMDGKVIGVTTLKLTGRDVSGIGFAVPITTVLEMLNITLKP